MTTGNTTLLGLALPVEGELDGTWGDVVNQSITELLDSAIAGTTTLSTDADVALTDTALLANQSRQGVLLWTAGGTVTRNITAPARSKSYIVINASSGTQSIVIRGVGPTTGVTVIKGEKALVAWNGSDFVKIGSSAGDVTVRDLAVTGTLAVTGATTLSSALTYGGVALSNSVTGTGSMVLSTSPTLVTPALGTPSSVVLSSGTGLPLTTGVIGTLPAANGGTNITSFTANGVVYASSTSALATGSVLSFDGGQLGVNGVIVGRGAGAIASNTAVGASSFITNVTGINNTAFGYESLQLSTASSNTAIGYRAGKTIGSGGQNSFFGNQSGLNTSSGSANTGVGMWSLTRNIIGLANVAVGYQSSYYSESSENVTIGAYAGYSNVSGSNNVALGYSAGRYETSSGSFYVDNQDRTNTAGDKAGALLYGTFNATPSSQTLVVNAKLTAAHGTVLPNLTASTALALDSAKNVVSVTNTGTGNNVLATSPTLVTPALGTPTSVNLTNGTSLPLTTGVTGTLLVSNGGTGSTTLTANAVLLGNGTLAPQVVAPSTTGNVLTSNGTTWSSQPPKRGMVHLLNSQITSPTPLFGFTTTGSYSAIVLYGVGIVGTVSLAELQFRFLSPLGGALVSTTGVVRMRTDSTALSTAGGISGGAGLGAITGNAGGNFWGVNFQITIQLNDQNSFNGSQCSFTADSTWDNYGYSGLVTANNSNEISGVRVFFNSGDISAGFFSAYGIQYL